HVALELWGLAVAATSVQVLEREPEPAEVLLPSRGHEVHALGDFVGAVDHPSQRPDHDVVDSAALARLQASAWGEVRRPQGVRACRINVPLVLPAILSPGAQNA